MSISIFARHSFVGVDSSPEGGSCEYLFRGSGLIRGEQMAEALGGKYNPTQGYENDLCIYVKPRNLDNIKDGSYVDISDAGDDLIEQLKRRPNIKAITSSEPTYKIVKEKLKNEIFLIPEHHCNFERIIRSKREINVAGFIGNPRSFTYPVKDMRKRLKKIGFEFITNFDWQKRQDVIDFYKQIDVQVVWYDQDVSPFKHPTKYINAAAFGIPTVANRLEGCQEWEENYIAVETVDSLIKEVQNLKNIDYYNQWSSKIINAAAEYHISKIAEKYKQLT